MFNQFAKHEDAFRDWRRDGLPGLGADSFKYIEFLTSPDDDQAARPGTLWPHQWESFLRILYAHEILGKSEIGADGLLLNIVTGGGKTALIAAVIAWLRIAHGVQKFVMLCPNLIVRDRLEDDFEGGKVFRDRDLLPTWNNPAMGGFELTTLGSAKEGGWADLLSATIVLGNIHQFYQSNKSGQSNLSALMNGPDFALFNDEAHNSPAPEYDPTVIEITKVGIAGVLGQELGGEGWKTIHSAPNENISGKPLAQISDESVREAVKTSLLEMAETLTVEAGYAASYKAQVYSALLHHVRAKFLNGDSLGLAERTDVDFAWKMLRQVKAKVGAVPGLIAGVIEYGN